MLANLPTPLENGATIWVFAKNTRIRMLFEFENVPAASIERLADAGALVAPGPTALRVSQDRVDEKTFLNAVGAPTVDFAVVDTLDDLVVGLTELGLPAC